MEDVIYFYIHIFYSSFRDYILIFTYRSSSYSKFETLFKNRTKYFQHFKNLKLKLIYIYVFKILLRILDSFCCCIKSNFMNKQLFDTMFPQKHTWYFYEYLQMKAHYIAKENVWMLNDMLRCFIEVNDKI